MASINASFVKSNGYASFISGKKGMLDENMKVVIYPIFTTLSQFDDKSGLAYAVFKDGGGKITRGFINRKGQFEIIVTTK
jgi:hypothetical protein